MTPNPPTLHPGAHRAPTGSLSPVVAPQHPGTQVGAPCRSVSSPVPRAHRGAAGCHPAGWALAPAPPRPAAAAGGGVGEGGGTHTLKFHLWQPGRLRLRRERAAPVTPPAAAAPFFPGNRCPGPCCGPRPRHGPTAPHQPRHPWVLPQQRPGSSLPPPPSPPSAAPGAGSTHGCPATACARRGHPWAPRGTTPTLGGKNQGPRILGRDSGEPRCRRGNHGTGVGSRHRGGIPASSGRAPRLFLALDAARGALGTACREQHGPRQPFLARRQPADKCSWLRRRPRGTGPLGTRRPGPAGVAAAGWWPCARARSVPPSPSRSPLARRHRAVPSLGGVYGGDDGLSRAQKHPQGLRGLHPEGATRPVQGARGASRCRVPWHGLAQPGVAARGPCREPPPPPPHPPHHPPLRAKPPPAAGRLTHFP